MKKLILLLAVAIGATAFTTLINKQSANADSQDGYYIFCYSKPTEKYDILGMAKVKGIVSNEKGSHMIELLIENAKKNFPSGEAIIVSSNFEKAEVIKFKQ